MTPIQIAYFKHFLFDKSIERSYINYYRKYRVKGSPRGDIDGNPESIEEFFIKTNVKDVIMKAFTFFPSNMSSRATNTYEYWKDIDDKWQDYMSQNENNFTNESWPQLRKTFAILRQNWDLPYFWSRDNFESTEEVYQRMHIDLPLPERQWAHGYIQQDKRPDGNLIKYDIHNAKDGDFVVRTRLLKGGVGRTIFIVKEVVPYDPETSGFTPEDLHHDYDPEKNNIHIAYLHARYVRNGESLSTDYKDTVHAVIDDNLETEQFRLAFKEEEQMMMLKLAEHQLAWNPATKTIVPLLDALNSKSENTTEDEKEPDNTIEFFPISEFEFLDDVKSSRNKLKTNEVSINFNNSYKITFNIIASDKIRESGLSFVRLAKNKAGDICLVINSQGGANITNKTSSQNNQNITINSKDICQKLRTFFSIKSDYSILCIKQLSSTSDFIIYKITKPQ